jgi:hypothetical protein
MAPMFLSGRDTLKPIVTGSDNDDAIAKPRAP